MSKGPSQAGNITQTTVNPTQQAQLPFLQQGWQGAANLFSNNPLQYYPGQTLANFNPAIAGGYNSIINATPGLAQGITTPADQTFGQGVAGNLSSQQTSSGIASDTLAGTGYLSGLFNNMATAGTGTGDIANNIASFGKSAAVNPYAGLLGNFSGTTINGLPLAQSTLGQEASGAFLNKNPYIDAQYQAAANPVVRNYMAATAPQTDSNFEAAGRYGSGAQANRVSQNQQDLSTGLGTLSANLYGNDYANERSLMQNAQSALGQLGLREYGARANVLNAAGNQYLSGLQTGIAGQNDAANIGLQDFNSRLAALTGDANTYLGGKQLAGNLENGLTTSALQSLGLTPTVLNSNYMPFSQEIGAGQGLTAQSQQQIQDLTNRFYGNQTAPYQTLQSFLNNIGQPTSGSNSITTPLLGPSPLSSALGTAGGLNSLFGGGSNSLFGSNGAFGSGGLFGGLFGGGATSALPVTAADAGLFADGLGLGGTGLDAALSFLPFGL